MPLASARVPIGTVTRRSAPRAIRFGDGEGGGGGGGGGEGEGGGGGGSEGAGGGGGAGGSGGGSGSDEGGGSSWARAGAAVKRTPAVTIASTRMWRISVSLCIANVRSTSMTGLAPFINGLDDTRPNVLSPFGVGGRCMVENS